MTRRRTKPEHCPDCHQRIAPHETYRTNTRTDHYCKDTTVATTPAPELFTTIDPLEQVQRDRYGRPLITPPSGGKPVSYRRCTTFVGVLEDTYNLSKWQQRQVALGLAARPDLLLAVSAHGDDKDRLNQVCADAAEAAGSSSAATIGTALHRIAERIDSGETLTVPDVAKADIDAYQAATTGMTWTHIEKITVHDTLKVAGTPDRVGVVPGAALPVVADLKTGSLDYGLGKIAMQLAMYAHSALYDPTTGARTALDVDLERALIIHLPAGTGTCNLVWVDIAAGWEAVQLAAQVWAWRGRKGLTTPYGPGAGAAPTTTAGPDPLTLAILAATTVDQLTTLWGEHKATWTDEHTALAAERKNDLTATAA